MTDWTIKRKESTVAPGHLIPHFLLKDFCSSSFFRLSGEELLHERRARADWLKQYRDPGDTHSADQKAKI